MIDHAQFMWVEKIDRFFKKSSKTRLFGGFFILKQKSLTLSSQAFAVGIARFELAASATRTQHSTKLSYIPNWSGIIKHGVKLGKKIKAAENLVIGLH